MVLSKTYRLLLIGLLPAVAYLIYIEGQKYDPALIRFSSSPAVRDNLTALFPPEIGKYSQIGPVRAYTKENLYEYVNGHAEYFISAGFTGLAVGEYGAAGSDITKPDVVVDIYDVGRSIQAFGILSDESGGNLSDLQDKLTGYRTPMGISFAKGKYYVKISVYNEKVSQETFIHSIASAIGPQADLFDEFSRLPDIGDVVATRFVKEAYRGLDFVNNVMEREYNTDGNTVRVFVIAGTKKETENLAGSFIDYFDQSDIPYSATETQGTKVYRVKDPYEGDWVLISSPDALFGIYGAYDDTMINALLKK